MLFMDVHLVNIKPEDLKIVASLKLGGIASHGDADLHPTGFVWLVVWFKLYLDFAWFPRSPMKQSAAERALEMWMPVAVWVGIKIVLFAIGTTDREVDALKMTGFRGAVLVTLPRHVEVNDCGEKK